MAGNKFSAREQDVITSLLQGKSNKEIALALGITNRTVESHLSNIYSKLGVSSRTEAVIKLPLWKSTVKENAIQENPQLNNDDGGVMLTKVLYHQYRPRRNSMKALVRMVILVLIVILMVTLIIAAFTFLRQPPRSLVASAVLHSIIGII